jgi:hypothetical protein
MESVANTPTNNVDLVGVFATLSISQSTVALFLSLFFKKADSRFLYSFTTTDFFLTVVRKSSPFIENRSQFLTV